MVDNSVLLEGEKKYLVVDVILYQGVKYIYFANEKDNHDFFIRKEIQVEEQNFLKNLENKEEFDFALNLFLEKNPNH